MQYFTDLDHRIPSEWLDKMKNLVFTYNKEQRYHEEFEGFDSKLNSGELTKVKQADVVLLNYPLLWKMPEDVLINDLNLYEDITDEYGPAMTWSIFAIKYTLYMQNIKTSNNSFCQLGNNNLFFQLDGFRTI